MSMRHSVVLELKRCRGCTTCIKCCPTEAIRVRGRKATILPDRCIDCGSCIRICPHKAIKSVGDSLDILKQYQYCVALPEPALYGQFQHLDSVDIVLNGLLKIGFHKVYEVAKAAEMISDFERAEHQRRPVQGDAPHLLLLSHSAPPHPHALPQAHGPCGLYHSAHGAGRHSGPAGGSRGDRPAAGGHRRIRHRALLLQGDGRPRSPKDWRRPVLDGAFAIRDIYLRLLNAAMRDAG